MKSSSRVAGIRPLLSRVGRMALAVLVLVSVAVIVLATSCRTLYQSQLIDHAGEANITLARLIGLAAGGRLRSSEGSTEAIDAPTVSADGEVQADRAVRHLIDGTPVVAVAIYDVTGAQLYATQRMPSDGRQPGLAAALGGRVVSDFVDLQSEDLDKAVDRGSTLALRSLVPLKDARGDVDLVVELRRDLGDVSRQASTLFGKVFMAGFGVMLVACAIAMPCVLRGVAHGRRQRDALRARHEALIHAKLAAERASRSKSAFLAHMSHEIRTPLHGLLGLAALLRHTTLTPIQSKYAASMEQSGRALLRILNDILDVAKIEADRLTLDEVDFDLRAVVGDTVSLVEATALQKGVTLCIDLNAAVPTRLRGDPVRLQQVLNNLVGNAVKFTERGSVRIGVSVANTGECGCEVRFVVEDTGIGIEEGALRRIFEPFTQAELSTSRRYGGTGLGLTIAGELVRAMGGRIEARSTPGLGSEFSFTCRLGHSSDRQSCVHGGATAQPTTRRPAAKRLLLAEDNVVNQMYAEALLTRLGYEVRIASNGREAVDLWLTDGPFDCILMDYHMPVLDGYEATRLIRHREAQSGNHRTRIVAVTASVMPEDRADALERGMDAVLGKPFSPQELEEVLCAPLAASGDVARQGADSCAPQSGIELPTVDSRI